MNIKFETSRFNNAVNKMIQFTGRERDKVVFNGTADFLFQAIKYTPIVEKGKMRTISIFQKVRHRYTGKEVEFFAGKKKIRIRGRGFARQAWILLLQAMGKNPRANYPFGPRRKSNAGKRGEMKQSGISIDSSWVEVANSVPYIVELDQGSSKNPPYHILARAISATSTKWEDTIKRMAERMGRQWL